MCFDPECYTISDDLYSYVSLGSRHMQIGVQRLPLAQLTWFHNIPTFTTPLMIKQKTYIISKLLIYHHWSQFLVTPKYYLVHYYCWKLYNRNLVLLPKTLCMPNSSKTEKKKHLH